MTAQAYNFPEPNWTTLLSERKQMETATDFELYVEGSTDSAPYYGARLEQRSGVYIGMVAENSDMFRPLGSYLTYMEVGNRQSDVYIREDMSDDVVIMLG